MIWVYCDLCNKSQQWLGDDPRLVGDWIVLRFGGELWHCCLDHTEADLLLYAEATS